jgi:putative endopeptidase
MTTKRNAAPWMIALVAASALAGVSLAATSKPQFGDWGFDAPGMDASAKPGDDFFRYVNGGWDTHTEIPPDKSGYGVDYVMADAAEVHLRGILETPPAGAADARKIHAAYVAFMDEKKAEALGAKPIAPDLAAIRAAQDRAAIAALMGHENVGFQSSLFDANLGPDEKDPGHYAVYLGQGGLGLPDRDYYLTEGFAQKKQAYQAYVASLLTLAGWPDPAASAAQVVGFETKVAEASWTRTDRRNVDKTYTPMSPAELQAAAPGFAWDAWLKAQGLGGVKRVIVQENTAVPKLAAIYAATPLETLRAWAAFHVADSAAPFLDHRFVDARFEFRSKLLQGQKEQKARWKRAVAFVDGGIGEAVGRAYVARYFPPDAKAKIDALVAELRVALGQRIDRLDWMSPETKARAHVKLAQFTVKIAYPDKWRDYSALRIDRDDLLGNVARASEFEYMRNINKLGQPIDRSEWGMNPQTINAYYNPEMNEIVFPAAILQPPFFDPKADDAVNYGAIGAVIGHEISHGFDDQGSQYDGSGNLHDWWTKDDHTKFAAKTKALVDEYAAFEPVKGYHLNGELTLGENIADNSGLAIAYKAYKISLHGQKSPVIDGMTGEQRFYAGFAQVWREKMRDNAMIEQIKSNEHSIPIDRVLGTVVNQPGFYDAFGVKPGDRMYVAPDKRVIIW